MNCYKNIMKSETNSAMLLKKDLIMNMYAIENIKKLK